MDRALALPKTFIEPLLDTQTETCIYLPSLQDFLNKSKLYWMRYLNTNAIKQVLLNKYWLVLSILGVFFTYFILNEMGTGVFIGTSAFFLLIQTIFGKYRIKTIPFTYLALGTIVFLIIALSFLFSFENTDMTRASRLIKFLIIVFTIHCISRLSIEVHIVRIIQSFLSLSILWEFVACILYRMPYGTFSNPHYLANFAALALPGMFYFFWVSDKVYKVIFFIVGLLDVHLLLLSSSRPAIMALFLSTMFVILFCAHRRYKWLCTFIIFILLLTIFLTDYMGVYSRFKDLAINFKEEERWQLWEAGWKMLSDNSTAAWIFGNGLGSISPSFKKYVSVFGYKWSLLTFPHLHIFEILYENGVVGAILIFSGISALLYFFIKFVRKATNGARRVLAGCILVMFLTSLFHTNMTFQFYSKYTLYPLAFIIGCVLAIYDQNFIDYGWSNTQ